MVGAIVAQHKLGPGKLSLLEVEHLAEHRIAVCCYCPEPALLRFGSARAVIDKRCMGQGQGPEEKQCNTEGFFSCSFSRASLLPLPGATVQYYSPLEDKKSLAMAL
jgi:hypothetical protein